MIQFRFRTGLNFGLMLDFNVSALLLVYYSYWVDIFQHLLAYFHRPHITEAVLLTKRQAYSYQKWIFFFRQLE